MKLSDFKKRLAEVNAASAEAERKKAQLQADAKINVTNRDNPSDIFIFWLGPVGGELFLKITYGNASISIPATDAAALSKALETLSETE